ncbi:hypothetical protein [Pelagibius sp.]|uniref:hypothetical protein n=1 Tax=Pelagibius sp. TaxID=1931238 RepID=UPI003B509FF3
MNRRTLVSRALLTTAFLAFAASTAAADTATKQIKVWPHGPKAPTAFAAPQGNDEPSRAGLQHDSDKQLDVWVQRCNDAGGGMTLSDDGNYDCVGSDGNNIDDY